VTKDILGYQLNKDVDIRMGFRRDVDPSEQACLYAAEDALATWLNAYTLEKQGTESTQVKCMIPLDTMARNGMLVDMDNFKALSKKLTDEYQEETTTLQGVWGLPIGKNKDLNGPQMLGYVKDAAGIAQEAEDKSILQVLLY
jgi:DNA polymerase I-like protein with 3'-5' exonuclease and polymerase domains